MSDPIEEFKKDTDAVIKQHQDVERVGIGLQLLTLKKLYEINENIKCLLTGVSDEKL